MTGSIQANATVGTDELASMLSAYTEVTERLQSSHDKLVAEVARLRQELASKNRQLERRSRLAALGEMAAGMAHEIRNPLGGIALYAGLLGKRLTDRSDLRKIADRIANGVDRLNVIVTDILTFAGEMKPQKRPVRLSGILAEVEDLVRGRLEEAGTRLTCHLGAEARLQADPTLLTRAVSNLLFNAADAAGEGEVLVTVEQSDEMVTLAVCDSGPGIDAEAMEKLFNPFFTTKDSGTGLGLAIVHQIVESHGGQVTASNATGPEGLGGARFVITLPKAG